MYLITPKSWRSFNCFPWWDVKAAFEDFLSLFWAAFPQSIRLWALVRLSSPHRFFIRSTRIRKMPDHGFHSRQDILDGLDLEGHHLPALNRGQSPDTGSWSSRLSVDRISVEQHNRRGRRRNIDFDWRFDPLGWTIFPSHRQQRLHLWKHFGFFPIVSHTDKTGRRRHLLASGMIKVKHQILIMYVIHFCRWNTD